MKKIFLSLMLVASVSIGTITAQKKGNRSHKEVSKELNLSAEQQAKVDNLRKDFKVQLQAVQKDAALSKDEKRDKSRELRRNQHAEFLAVLTPEQQAKLKDSPRHRQDRTRKHTNDRRSNNDSLNLTAEQKEKVREIKKNYRAKLDELRNAQNEEIKSVLTPEQQSAFNAKNSFNKRGNHMFDNNRRHHINMDSETKAKLKQLRTDFQNEKKAVEMSRIAPDMQKQRIESLSEKYRNDKRAILKEFRENNKSKSSAV